MSHAAKVTRSALEAWRPAALPIPPIPSGLGWLAVVGPGVIVLGASIGSGEFLLGPAAFVRYGFPLLWVTVAAVVLQTIFNTEVMRYVLATGEPVISGFMRTRPSPGVWASLYVGLCFLQFGWPAFAATAAGALFFLAARRMPGPDDAAAVHACGVVLFMACAAVLCVGRRIERTLELANWVLVAAILTTFLLLALWFVPPMTWAAGLAGLVGFDLAHREFAFMPSGADFFLIGALVAYSGAGGMTNLALGNWARDRGYGMGGRAGFIPGAIGGARTTLVVSGFVVADDEQSRERWRGWWRIVRADQWGVFCVGAIAGMLLPALLYVESLPRGTDIQGLGISAALASKMSARAGALVGGIIAFLGAWTLFKTQLDVLEAMVRTITDVLWTGSPRVRAWRGGDVRAVYYGVLAVTVAWGTIALGFAQPIVLLKLGANVAGLVFVVASLHLLYINTHLLPLHVRPSRFKRLALLAVAMFYAVFVTLSVTSGWS